MAKVDQCLFGYDDGHRLLASSTPLANQASTLTELSDLAPGTVFGKSDGYWTGIPIPQLRRYALMRTWPAPEMPRPGCVWTHAVLLDPRLLEQLEDTAELRGLFTRPDGPRDLERYREPLVFGPDIRGEVPPPERGREAPAQVVRALLANLYGRSGHSVAIRTPGDADEGMFAVWSQQWPRLRRNFRFQTAATREVVASPAIRFDLTVDLSNAGDVAPLDLPGNQAWLDAAVADVGQGASGELRSFLWTYGRDVKRQRGSFRPLVEIKLLNNGGERAAGDRLLDLVGRHFPEVEDGRALKQDIVDGAVVPTAQLDVLRYILIEGGNAAFPPPSPAGVARLTSLWPQKPAELLALAESTADADEGLGRSVFETVTNSAPIEEFWALTGPFARVREEMISARPELLVLDGASDLSDADLARYVGLVPAESPIVAELVTRMAGRNDVQLARTVLDRFEKAGAEQVVTAAIRDRARVSRAWIRALVERPRLLLSPEILGQAKRTSLLYEFAEELGWLNPHVVAGGTEPWIAGLVDVQSDLSEERRDTLRAFLVALGLTVGGEGGRRLLEKFFDAVHLQILKSRLPWRARDILSPVLPDIGWLSGWDVGLRLRLAVAKCYVSNHYAPESFAGLSSSNKTRKLLGTAAAEVTGGKVYARAVEL